MNTFRISVPLITLFGSTAIKVHISHAVKTRYRAEMVHLHARQEPSSTQRTCLVWFVEPDQETPFNGRLNLISVGRDIVHRRRESGAWQWIALSTAGGTMNTPRATIKMQLQNYWFNFAHKPWITPQQKARGEDQSIPVVYGHPPHCHFEEHLHNYDLINFIYRFILKLALLSVDTGWLSYGHPDPFTISSLWNIFHLNSFKMQPQLHCCVWDDPA